MFLGEAMAPGFDLNSFDGTSDKILIIAEYHNHIGGFVLLMLFCREDSEVFPLVMLTFDIKVLNLMSQD